MQNTKRYTDYIYSEKGEKVKRFILEIGEHRIILSNPEIQAFSEYEFEEISDALYFYHDFIIEKNVNFNAFDDEFDCDNIPDWKPFASVYVYEDSSTKVLPWFIDEVLNYDIKNESKKHYFITSKGINGKAQKSKTDYECREYFNLEGFDEEDIYSIVKYCRYFEKAYNDKSGQEEPKYVEFYKMFFLCGCMETGNNHEGFEAYLEEKDLIEVKKWAEDFISYAENKEKENIKRKLKSKKIEKFFCPGVFRKHLSKKYPEDISRFEEIFKAIDKEELVSNRYYQWIIGETPEKELFIIDKTGTQYTLPELVKTGMKDWEACQFMIEIIKNNRMR